MGKVVNIKMKHIRHIGIYVQNFEKMRNFYKDNLNLQEVFCGVEKSGYIEQILNLPCGAVSVCKLIFPEGGMLELLHTNERQQSAKPAHVWRIGKHHIAITVENVDAEYKRLNKLGVEFISAPCISPNLAAKVCFCKDPEGNYMELVEELKR